MVITPKQRDKFFVIFVLIGWIVFNATWIVWCWVKYGIQLVIIIALALCGLVLKGLIIESNKKYKKKYGEEIFDDSNNL